MVEVLPIETPPLGDRSYLAHDGEVAAGDRPAARHRPGPRPGRRRAACGSPTWSRPTCTTTTSPAALRWPGRPARLPGQRRRPGRLRPHPGRRRRRGRGRRRCGVRVAGHARAHLHHLAYVLDGRRRRRWHGRRLHRRVAAVRLDRPHRPARPRAHRDAHPRAVRARPAGWPPNCPTAPRSSPPTGSAASARPRQTGRRRLHHRPGEAGQPGAHPGRAGLTSTTLLAGLDAYPPTTRTWARPTPPARPRPTCRRRARPTPAELRRPHRGRGVGGRPARPASPSPPGTWPARSASRWTTASPPTWAG